MRVWTRKDPVQYSHQNSDDQPWLPVLGHNRMGSRDWLRAESEFGAPIAELLAAHFVSPTRNLATTGQWSLGNWPSRWNVTISIFSAVTSPRDRIQSIR